MVRFHINWWFQKIDIPSAFEIQLDSRKQTRLKSEKFKIGEVQRTRYTSRAISDSTSLMDEPPGSNIQMSIPPQFIPLLSPSLQKQLWRNCGRVCSHSQSTGMGAGLAYNYVQYCRRSHPDLLSRPLENWGWRGDFRWGVILRKYIEEKPQNNGPAWTVSRRGEAWSLISSRTVFESIFAPALRDVVIEMSDSWIGVAVC